VHRVAGPEPGHRRRQAASHGCAKNTNAHFTGPACGWSNERRDVPQLQAVLKIAKGEAAKL
jgi:hypothetical protein